MKAVEFQIPTQPDDWFDRHISKVFDLWHVVKELLPDQGTRYVIIKPFGSHLTGDSDWKDWIRIVVSEARRCASIEAIDIVFTETEVRSI